MFETTEAEKENAALYRVKSGFVALVNAAGTMKRQIRAGAGLTPDRLKELLGPDYDLAMSKLDALAPDNGPQIVPGPPVAAPAGSTPDVPPFGLEDPPIIDGKAQLFAGPKKKK